MQKMARIFDEARTSYATHNRKLKELAAIRSKVASIHQFSAAFAKTLTPLFQVQRRTASAERVVRFVSVFTGIRGPENISACEVFLEDFLRFLLVGAGAANKTARFRCCQIISEVLLISVLDLDFCFLLKVSYCQHNRKLREMYKICEVLFIGAKIFSKLEEVGYRARLNWMIMGF